MDKNCEDCGTPIIRGGMVVVDGAVKAGDVLLCSECKNKQKIRTHNALTHMYGQMAMDD